MSGNTVDYHTEKMAGSVDWKSVDRYYRDLLPELLTLHLIVERRGASGAALELGLSRQAVSYRSSTIERLLGSRLFETNSRGRMTPLGGRAHQLCKRVLDDLNLFLIEAERIQNGKEVRIASITSSHPDEVEMLHTSFQRSVPEGCLSRVDVGDDYSSVEAAVRDGLVDVGIVTAAPRGVELPLVLTHWRDEHMVLAMSARRRLLRPITEARPSDFENHDTFLSLESRSAMGKEIARYMSVRRIRLPHKRSHFQNLSALKQAVSDDEGIAILPEGCIRYEGASRLLQVFPLAEPLTRRIGLLYRSESCDRPAFATFLKCFTLEKRSFLKQGKVG